MDRQREHRDACAPWSLASEGTVGVMEGVRMAGTRFGDVEHAESSAVAAARRVFAQSFCAAAHAGYRKGYIVQDEHGSTTWALGTGR